MIIFRRYLIFVFVFHLRVLLSQSPTDSDLLEYSSKDVHAGKHAGVDAPKRAHRYSPPVPARPLA